MPGLNAQAFWERDIYVHQWDKLLSSMEISIPKLTLRKRTGKGELEGERVIARKEAHSLHWTRVESGKHLCIEAT